MTTRNLSTGTYIVSNVGAGNIAALRDGNYGTPVSGEVNKQANKGKWTVERLSNGNYTFKNHEYPSRYASVENRPDTGATVQGKPGPTQYVIKETRETSKYTIKPVDSDDIWGLPDTYTGTPIELRTSYGDKTNWWTFEEFEEEVEEEVEEEAEQEDEDDDIDYRKKSRRRADSEEEEEPEEADNAADSADEDDHDEKL
ncbi:hypothetical protein EIP91_003153 [Steccherinum ochraceum]|uniref:Ricin B lectin domain-containing protein n=1 Tax=Steccherinum ochraceum TaxID=92696 RepID=A0A4R0RS91_9APHY|nr:hypothetical protein EIP91_003153 [Steccherinum ochraceum]